MGYKQPCNIWECLETGYPPKKRGIPQKKGYPPQKKGYPPQKKGYPPKMAKMC